MIVVTVKVDWGQETIQEILPELKKHVEITLMGLLIIFFLIVEPHGLARLWQIAKEKLRMWPFPY